MREAADASQGSIDLVRYSRGEETERSHLLSESKLGLESDLFGNVFEDDDRPLSLSGAGNERSHPKRYHLGFVTPVAEVQARYATRLGPCPPGLPHTGHQDLLEGDGKQLFDRAAQSFVSRDAVQSLEGTIPADDLAVQIEH